MLIELVDIDIDVDIIVFIIIKYDTWQCLLKLYKTNTTGTTSGAGTAYPSIVPDFTLCL